MAEVETFDTIVVGSGFGGSVMAYRLQEAGQRVLIMERGRAYKPGQFARTIPGAGDSFWDPSAKLYGRFNVWFFHKLGALVSSGLGGGSLIYANVLLRKPPEWFAGWPIEYRDLESHYDVVENILAPSPYPNSRGYDVPRVRAFRGAIARLAARDPSLRVIDDPPLAIDFSRPGEDLGIPIPGDNLHGVQRRTCTACGDCVVGCNVGAKRSLDYTYLTMAKRLGAEIRTLHELVSFRRAHGKTEVTYVIHDPETGTKSPPKTLRCDRLVIAAGTMGSTYLMLKNAASVGPLRALGTKFSGNGDQLGFAVDCDERIDAMFGPSITSALRGEDFYVEDSGYPHELAWLAEGFAMGGWIERGARFLRVMLRKMWGSDRDTDLGAQLRDLLGNAKLTSHFLPLLAMGRDSPEGVFSLSKRDDPDDPQYLELDWPGTKSAEYFERVTAIQKAIAEELGGRFMKNVPSMLFSRAVTVHPLGGCPMGTSAEDSVVDSFGRVHGAEGLHVIDGSILPTAVGPNPSLTIAAVANRAADRILGY